MIQTSSISKPADLFRGDHQAAASALPVILSGDDAGHRTTTGHPVGSPRLRRSAVLLKPATMNEARMTNGRVSVPPRVPPGRYPAKFLGVRHEAVFEVAAGISAGDIVRLPFDDAKTARKLGPAVSVLLNSGQARLAAKQLHAALGEYLDDSSGGGTGIEVTKQAAAVLNAVADFRFQIGMETC